MMNESVTDVNNGLRHFGKQIGIDLQLIKVQMTRQRETETETERERERERKKEIQIMVIACTLSRLAGRTKFIRYPLSLLEIA